MRTKVNVKNKSALILHLDGDSKYARKAFVYYNNMNLNAIVENVPEMKQPIIIRQLLEKYNPNILISTGHDLMLKKGQGFYNMENYKNSKYFARVVREARNWNKNEDNFTIIAGACESFFEAIMSEGANFASSPARIMIDYKEPLIVATKVANTSKNRYISIDEIIPELKDGRAAIGGTRTKGKN